MTLLVRPPIRVGEGPQGYLLRLAEANGITLRGLASLGISFSDVSRDLLRVYGSGDERSDYAELLLSAMDMHPGVWNWRTPRFCPTCLELNGFWSCAWELYWVDACPCHQTWLIDRCPKCGGRMGWTRDTVARCSCGGYLVSAKPVPCPDAVCELSSAIASSALGGKVGFAYGPVNSLNVSQIHRLVRVIAAYGDGVRRVKPQKLANVDQLDVSWGITSLAAEVLARGAEGLHDLFHRIHSSTGDCSTRRLTDRFGHFYAVLYRGFAEPEFAFLRDEFEAFIGERWRGVLAKRNRNFSEKVLEKCAWIPAGLACKELAVSRRTLSALVSEGRIEADDRVGVSGRRFLVVKRVDVLGEVLALRNEISLTEAAGMLGLQRRRLQRMLPHLIPEATKRSGCYGQWWVPKGFVASVNAISIRLPVVPKVADQDLVFGDLLRYWPWSDKEVAAFLLDVVATGVQPLARVDASTCATSWVLRADEVKGWYSAHKGESRDLVSIPEAAVALEVKEEVAYALVGNGLLKSVLLLIGRRRATRVSKDAIAAFRSTYVLGRKLATEMGTSPRRISEQLQRLGVDPVCGPSVDGSRQYVFARSGSLDSAMGLLRAGARAVR